MFGNNLRTQLKITLKKIKGCNTPRRKKTEKIESKLFNEGNFSELDELRNARLVDNTTVRATTATIFLKKKGKEK